MECKTCAHRSHFGSSKLRREKISFCQLTKQWVPPTHGCNAHTNKQFNFKKDDE
jgi:hypothetical protein